jgi:hypothetical protein
MGRPVPRRAGTAASAAPAAAVPALIALLAALLVPLCRPAAAQLVVASETGDTTFRLGTIDQLQAESLTNADGSHDDNLFFRRVRLLGAFTSGDLSVFFQTDSGTLGKGNADGSKQSASTVFFQDFTVTYRFAQEFQLDGGLIRLVPNYDHNISANSTMALDISPYAYIESAALTGLNGRDYGIEARGYLDDHLEYRFGAFQGLRGQEDVNAFRYSGRLAWYFFGPEEGLVYRGTSLGKYQTFEIGTGYDAQKSYKNYNVDLYWDQPLRGGDGLTLQLDQSWYNRNDFIPALPEQQTRVAEIGYYLGALKLLPFFQFTQEKYAAGVPLPSEKRFQFGAGYYFHGYNSNLKLAWTRIDRDGVRELNDLVLQYQFYVF